MCAVLACLILQATASLLSASGSLLEHGIFRHKTCRTVAAATAAAAKAASSTLPAASSSFPFLCPPPKVWTHPFGAAAARACSQSAGHARPRFKLHCVPHFISYCPACV